MVLSSEGDKRLLIRTAGTCYLCAVTNYLTWAAELNGNVSIKTAEREVIEYLQYYGVRETAGITGSFKLGQKNGKLF